MAIGSTRNKNNQSPQPVDFSFKRSYSKKTPNQCHIPRNKNQLKMSSHIKHKSQLRISSMYNPIPLNPKKWALLFLWIVSQKVQISEISNHRWGEAKLI